MIVKMTNFTFIDLFAGIDDIRRPYQKLGGKCVFSSEIDKFAIKTYEANWNETPSGIINTLDLLNVKYSDTTAYGHFGKEYLNWEK